MVDGEDPGEATRAFRDKAKWFGEEREGEKLPSGRATKNRIKVNREVVAKWCRQEPGWVEGIGEDFRKEQHQLKGP